ncbi:mitochondrial carrier [Neoconidiobolus thromboides FSU 785]|nr:mitochondrial carrier [Neoconidiobolus thromboides FSU 785]
MVSACTGSLLTSLIVTPFDVVKTRLQFQSFSQTKNNMKPCQSFVFCNTHRGLMLCDWPVSNVNLASSLELNPGLINSNLKFNGTIDAFLKISKVEGFGKLWRGLSPALDKMYEKIDNNPKYTFYVPLLAGSLARSISATIISPLELFRTRLQSASKGQTYKDVSKEILKMVQQQGIRSLWSGLTPTLWRDIPFSGIYWTGYEYLKKELNQQGSLKLSPFSNSFISGASSGILAAIITTPFDVLKTRTQVSNKKNSISTFKMMNKIIKREGVKELFSGVIPRTAKVAPACAIMVSSYEFGKTFFSNLNQS